MRAIEFTQNGSRFEAEFDSAGKEVFQINRTERARFDIYSKIGGAAKGDTPWVNIYTEYPVGERQNLLFILDIPKGIKVKMVSYSEIDSAYAESTN